MTRILLWTLLAGLAFAPVAARAQPPAYSSPQGPQDQNGSSYDRDDGAAGGYYDQNGNWVPDATTQPPYDENDGGYDRDGAPLYDSSDDDDSGRNDRAPYDSRANDPRRSDDSYAPRDERGYRAERWSYDERGRHETLDLAARDFARRADRLAREAYRHAGYRDRAALAALERLDRAATRFARAANRDHRPEVVGRAYSEVVRSFVEAQRRVAVLRPDGWLDSELRGLGSALHRLDRRYFGGRGRLPGWGDSRPY